MNKRIVAALVAVAMLVVGVVLLISYANGANERAFDGARLRSVLQVEEPIAANTAAGDIGDKVKKVELPASAIAKGALSSLTEVSGLSTTIDLEPGEQVLASRFAEKGSSSASTGSKSKTAVPEGMQELTIPVDVARALGGALKVGDTVGVVASYKTEDGDGITRIVQNRVQILRISDGGPVEEGQTGGTQLVTFAVKTRDAGKIVNAIEFGKVYLTRQNDDTEFGQGGSISRNDVTE